MTKHPGHTQEVKDNRNYTLRKKSRLHFCPYKKCAFRSYEPLEYKAHACSEKTEDGQIVCSRCQFQTLEEDVMTSHLKEHLDSQWNIKSRLNAQGLQAKHGYGTCFGKGLVTKLWHVSWPMFIAHGAEDPVPPLPAQRIINVFHFVWLVGLEYRRINGNKRQQIDGLV